MSTNIFVNKTGKDEKVKNDSKANTEETAVKSGASGVNITPGNPAARTEPVKNLTITPGNPAARDSGGDVSGSVLGASDVKGPTWDANANFGVRESLENEFGVSGDAIGYKDGNVLLNGKFLLKADNNVDGTTYVKGREQVVDPLVQYAQNNGIVAVRDYATSKGGPVDIGWDADSGTVLVNGMNIKPEYIIDGKAYVKKSVIDGVMEESPLKTNSEILSGVNAEYGDEVKAMYDKLMNTPEFSYNPDNDPMYQAYVAMQKKAITDAYNKNVASARFRTGGVPSVAAMQQAEALRADAVDNIASRQADFEQMAYQRYNDGIERDYNNYLVAKNLRDSVLAERLSANSGDKSDWYKSKEFDLNQLLGELGYENQKLQNEGVSLQNILTSLGIDSAKLENDLDSKYLPEIYRFEYNDAKRQDEVGEKYTLPLAELGYQNQILQNDSLEAGIAGQRAQTSATQASVAGQQQDMKLDALGAAQTMLALKENGYSEDEINALMAYYL